MKSVKLINKENKLIKILKENVKFIGKISETNKI